MNDLKARRGTPTNSRVPAMSAYGGKVEFRHPAALVVVVLGLCAALTVAVVALPFVQFAYRAPALHVSLETANALIALLVAYLVYGRYRSSRRLQDLLLTMSLCTVAGANLLLTALPTALSFGQGGHATDRGATVIRLLAIVMLTAAAVVPRRTCVRDRRTVVGIASIAVLGAVLRLLLVGSVGVEGVLAAPPGSATRPLLDSDPALLAAEALAAVLFDVAAVCLTRKAAQHHDELLRWVAAACVVGVFTRIHYLLYPSLYSD